MQFITPLFLSLKTEVLTKYEGHSDMSLIWSEFYMEEIYIFRELNIEIYRQIDGRYSYFLTRKLTQYISMFHYYEYTT